MSYVDIDAALLTKLLTVTAVTDIVGDRIYPGDLPQDIQYPALCFYEEEGGSHNLLNGQSSGLAYALYEFEATAETRAGVKELLEAVRVGIVGYKGIVTTPGGDCNIQEVSLEATGRTLRYEALSCFAGTIDLHIQWQEANGNG